jgi:hypothetical protein
MKTQEPQVEAIKLPGYSNAQPLSLYLVASHSGYFMGRQFLGFPGTDWGNRTAHCWKDLQADQNVRFEYKAPLTFNRRPRQGRQPALTEVNASPKVLFTVSFTSPFTRTHNLAHSTERAYLRLKCVFCTWPKPGVGLERPHSAATETVAVAPAQPIFASTRRIAEPYTGVANRV